MQRQCRVADTTKDNNKKEELEQQGDSGCVDWCQQDEHTRWKDSQHRLDWSTASLEYEERFSCSLK